MTTVYSVRSFIGRISILGCVASGLILGTECPGRLDGPPSTEAKSMVGKLTERDILIGLVVDGPELVAYVCDGVEGPDTLSGWFVGQLQDGSFTLPLSGATAYEGTGAGRTLTGTVGAAGADGVLILEDGTQIPWTAQLAAIEAAGLYIEEDEEGITSAVVNNDEQLLGLKRSNVTGWTAKVQPAGAIALQDQKLAVTVANQQKTLPIVKKAIDVTKIVVNRADPLPTLGNGTLMVMVLTDGEKATGYRYAVPRPDRISIPTVNNTRLMRDQPDPRVLRTQMRIRLLDAKGNVLAVQFISDPLDRRIEVPADAKGGNPFWTTLPFKPGTFLLAVPNIKGTRRLLITRFNDAGQPTDGGGVDLGEKPTPRKKPLVTAQAAGYSAADAEHDPVVINGAAEERFDVLFLAEGFQDTPQARTDFDQGITDVLNYLWSMPIYLEHQQALNIHKAFIGSVDAGADHLEDNPDVLRDTPFETFFGCNNIERLVCVGDAGQELAYEIAENSPGNYGEGSVDQIFILVNDTEYGGGGGTVLTASVNGSSPEIASHEFGHSAIDLADEYEEPPYDQLVEWSRTRANVSGTVNNINEVKWADLLDPSATIVADTTGCTADGNVPCSPSPFSPGSVGMFEGAGYSPCESYRPLTECNMRCYALTFCPVCDREFRRTLGVFQPPDVDIYMRDNSLDLGFTPSPSGVEDPATGLLVRPYHSVDVRVDAPPFGDPNIDAPHENAQAGSTNRVIVTVHNRGRSPALAPVTLNVYAAAATGGAPPFPGGNWIFVGTTNALQVAGANGLARAGFDWDVQPNAAAHTCLLAMVDTPADPLPAATAGLSQYVRDSNNVTWKNLHIVRQPKIEGQISNFEQRVVPIVLRITAATVPLGTEFIFSHQENIALAEFDPAAAQQMDLLGASGNSYRFARAQADQEIFSWRADLPVGDDKDPFVATFTLIINLPGGTPVGSQFPVDISQIEIDPNTGVLGNTLGGNTYELIVE